MVVGKEGEGTGRASAPPTPPQAPDLLNFDAMMDLGEGAAVNKSLTESMESLVDGLLLWNQMDNWDE